MVIASGSSSRQVAAMAEHLETKLKQQKIDILGLEGLRQADWVLLDANDVIVHLFRPEVREFYGLERMWADDSSGETIKVGQDG
jgi:ribosome-associated protein